jgi:hypothetical protein
MRVPWGAKVVVSPMCSACIKRMAKPSMQGRITHEAKESLDDGIHEMAYLFMHGQRIRIVWGRELHSEVIQ